MDVSIIIVNYNTKDLTINCLRSIFRHTSGISYEVIVVDNSSIDGSQKSIKKLFPQVILIENKENMGFGKANNLAAKRANGKYLFFLNSDTILLNNAIYMLFNFNEKKSTELKIGVSGGILLDNNKRMTLSFGPFPTMIGTLKSLVLVFFKPRLNKMTFKEVKFFKANNFMEVDYITGADMFINRSLFIESGGFDPIFFMYFEETDLQFRLKKLGYNNYLIFGPQIIHIGDGSSNKIKANNLKRIYMVKSTFHYFRKHSNRLSFFLFKTLYFILRIPTILYLSYTIEEKKNYLKSIINS